MSEIRDERVTQPPWGPFDLTSGWTPWVWWIRLTNVALYFFAFIFLTGGLEHWFDYRHRDEQALPWFAVALLTAGFASLRGLRADLRLRMNQAPTDAHQGNAEAQPQNEPEQHHRPVGWCKPLHRTRKPVQPQ